jgi:hypothetical protein
MSAISGSCLVKAVSGRRRYLDRLRRDPAIARLINAEAGGR